MFTKLPAAEFRSEDFLKKSEFQCDFLFLQEIYCLEFGCWIIHVSKYICLLKFRIKLHLDYCIADLMILYSGIEIRPIVAQSCGTSMLVLGFLYFFYCCMSSVHVLFGFVQHA